MNKTLKIVLISAVVLLVAVALIFAGLWINQRQNPGWGLMGGFWNNSAGQNYGTGRGRMGGFWNNSASQNYAAGRGMMSRFWNKPNNGYGMGAGMMGGYFSNSTANIEPLSIASAQTALEEYLGNQNNDDLELKEIMIFDQNAYAIVIEKSTGIGALELLVDPASLSVFLEYGPARMWNSKYGMMGNAGFRGARGCAMASFFNAQASTSAEMTFSLEQAAEAAGQYLAENIAGAELEQNGQAFYGYYTFDYKVDGQTAGMLSVNGTSGQVWPHTWHGQFIEEWEMDESD